MIYAQGPSFHRFLRPTMEVGTSRMVPSDLNLLSWLTWWKEATPKQKDEAKNLYVVVHHRNSTCRSPPVKIDNHVLPERDCMDVGCERCMGRMGYRWQWTGRWTCIQGIGRPHEHPSEVRERWIKCSDEKCKAPGHSKRLNQVKADGDGTRT